jgi:hypothetical protein
MTTTRHQVTIRWGVKPTDGAVVYVGGRLRFGMRFRRLDHELSCHHVKVEGPGAIEPATGSAGLEPLIKKRRVSPAPKASLYARFVSDAGFLRPLSRRCS